MYDKLLEGAVLLGAAAITAWGAYKLNQKVKEISGGMGLFEHIVDFYNGVSARIRAWIAENPNQTIRRILGKVIQTTDDISAHAQVMEIYVETSRETAPITKSVMTRETFQQLQQERGRKIREGETMELTQQLLPIVQGA